MAGSKTNYQENRVLNVFMSAGGTIAAPSLYLALCTASPGEAATGASCNETANAAGYARQSITFTTATTGSISNSNTINFPAATAGYGATLTHWAIVDSATYGAGNVLYHGTLTTSKSVSIDDVVQVPIGNIVITED